VSQSFPLTRNGMLSTRLSEYLCLAGPILIPMQEQPVLQKNLECVLTSILKAIGVVSVVETHMVAILGMS